MTTQLTDQTERLSLQDIVVASTLPRVNLLPPEIVEAGRLRSVQLSMGAAVVAALVVVGGLWVVANQQAQSEQEKLDAAAVRQATVSKQVTSLAPVAAVYNQVDQRRQLLETALGGDVQWSQYLTDLSLTIPDNVWLTSMTVSPQAATAGTGGTAGTAGTADQIANITFAGTALQHDDVALWLESLAKQKGYTSAYFNSSTEKVVGASTVVDFSSTVVVTREALSGRYLQNAGK
ncbi:MAG: type pilus assembly protein PilN [Actinomycetota bacterium]|jgi:Tfp pilus assembly protein PilN|nr:Fimbrial assembly family protein [Cryptosporangiaceae bacterium]MDQ1677570.1 type pilus assembly protein PilN [Actinomycetota bacterium]